MPVGRGARRRSSGGNVTGLTRYKGMNYRAWWAGAYGDSESDDSLALLRVTGVDTVAITVFVYQAKSTSVVVEAGDRTPTDVDLNHVIQVAQGLGFKVMVKIHIVCVDGTETIGQNFDEADMIAWFASYGSWVNHFADIAETNSIELFCVATGMYFLRLQSARWRSLITTARLHFTGPMTYASLHGGDENTLDWWDALDVIGVNAYYHLTDYNDPTYGELVQAWQPSMALLGALATKWGKKIIFTEVGFRNQDGTNIDPVDWEAEGTPDSQEQRLCYAATLGACWYQDWMLGMFWWEWGTLGEAEANEEMGYQPLGYPAEQELRHWWK